MGTYKAVLVNCTRNKKKEKSHKKRKTHTKSTKI